MPGRRPSRTLLALASAALVAIWGTTWAVIRISNEGFPPFYGVAARFAVSSALLLAVAPLVGVKLGTRPLERRLWITNGLLSFSVSYGVVYWSEQYIPSGLASVLFATFPLLVALMAHVAIPGERLTLRGLAGCGVGFAGVAVIFSEDFRKLGGEHVATAAAVMLISPLAGALSNVLIKRWGAGIHPLSLAAVPMGIAAAVMAAASRAFERTLPVTPTPGAVAALAYLAVFGSAVTFTLYYWLLAHLPATRVALVNYLIPLVAVAVGAVFLDEPLTSRTVVGSLGVVAGVAVAVQASRAQSARSSPR